jgi:hypothetical protein
MFDIVHAAIFDIHDVSGVGSTPVFRRLVIILALFYY